jgi:hypothetical protein
LLHFQLSRLRKIIAHPRPLFTRLQTPQNTLNNLFLHLIDHPFAYYAENNVLQLHQLHLTPFPTYTFQPAPLWVQQIKTHAS